MSYPPSIIDRPIRILHLLGVAKLDVDGIAGLNNLIECPLRNGCVKKRTTLIVFAAKTQSSALFFVRIIDNNRVPKIE